MSVPAIIIDKSASEVPLAQKLAELMNKNIETHTEKKKFLTYLKTVVCVHACDVGTKLTLFFNRGSCVIFNGMIGKPDLEIETTEEQLLKLSSLSLIMGMPSLVDETGKDLAKKLFSGEVKIRGLFFHPVALTMLSNIFSVNAGFTRPRRAFFSA